IQHCERVVETTLRTVDRSGPLYVLVAKSLVDKAANAVQLSRRYERADIGVRRKGITDDALGGYLTDDTHDIVLDARCGVDPARGVAVLTRVAERRHEVTLAEQIEVGIVEDQHRRIAPEFQLQPLQRVGGVTHHGTPGSCPAGEGDHVDLWRAGHRSTRLKPTGYDVQYTGWQYVRRQGTQHERGQRRFGRGLEHDGVPSCQRWSDFPDRHRERIVPGRDGTDDTDRFSPDEACQGLAVLVRCDAGEDTGRPGVEPDLVVSTRYLGRDHGQGLANGPRRQGAVTLRTPFNVLW